MAGKSRQSREVIGSIVLLLLALVLTTFPRDFWDEKPFTEWSEQQAIKLISDSPWARQLTVLGSILGAGRTVGNRSSELPNVATPSGGRSSGAVMSTGTSLGASEGFAANDPVPVYVRWLSSVSVRQALGRLGQIQSRVVRVVRDDNVAALQALNQKQGELAEQEMHDYQIAVIAPVMDKFDDLSVEDFRGKTFLLSKRNKSKKIPLKSYTAPRDRSDGVALFSFERLLDGRPTFGLEDQEVEFLAEGGRITLKTSFKLAKMLKDGMLDL